MKHLQLVTKIENYGVLDKKEKELISTFFNPFQIKKKTILIDRDSPCNKLFFVNKGLLRAYYITSQGREVTRMIAWENRFLTNISSFRNFTQNNEIIECIENAEILSIEKDDFENILRKSQNLKCIYADLLEEYNSLHIKRYEHLNSGDSIEKLKYFKDNFFQLKNRLSDHILASFLSISRKTIERNKLTH